MLKNKYDRMSKEEKKKIVGKYKQTEAGSVMMMRLTRLKITGIIGIICSIGLLIFSSKSLEIIDLLSIIPLFLASILFIMMSYKLKRKVLNQFVIKNKI